MMVAAVVHDPFARLMGVGRRQIGAVEDQFET